jgi:N-acetylglutamate synthase-like GNAT family acetyltransferase
MSIRNLADCPNHIPQIAQWFFNEWGYQVPGNSVEATVSRLESKLNLDKAPLLLILEEGGKAMGVGALKIREMKEFPEREYWLGDVFIAPAARGKGCGSRLADAVAEQALRLGIKHLWLQTDDQQSLYSRLGWKEVETVPKGERIASIMLRELDI